MTTQEKSQNLEVISNPLHPAHSKPAPFEKRRRPRISLSSEQFRLAANGKLFSVVDLSLDGMAFRVIDRNDLAILPVQMRIEGILNLRGERYFIRGRVMRLAGSMVGCQFEEDLPKATAEALKGFLDPEMMGKELRPIPASANSGSLWFHGPSGTDLLLSHESGGKYLRVTAYLLGSYVQWDEQEGLATGRVLSSERRSDFRQEEWGIVQFETMVMTPDSVLDPQKLAIAKALVLSSNLPQDLKNWCAEHLAVTSG